MQIFGPFRISTAQATGAAQRPQMQPPADSGASRLAGPVDQLDLSSAAQAAGTTASAGAGEIRTDRVAELRRQIASGTYDTPQRLDAALERMLDRLG